MKVPLACLPCLLDAQWHVRPLPFLSRYLTAGGNLETSAIFEAAKFAGGLRAELTFISQWVPWGWDSDSQGRLSAFCINKYGPLNCRTELRKRKSILSAFWRSPLRRLLEWIVRTELEMSYTRNLGLFLLFKNRTIEMQCYLPPLGGNYKKNRYN